MILYISIYISSSHMTSWRAKAMLFTGLCLELNRVYLRNYFNQSMCFVLEHLKFSTVNFPLYNYCALAFCILLPFDNLICL